MLPHPSVSDELSESSIDGTRRLAITMCAASNAGGALASFAAARLVYQRMQALQMLELTSIRPVSYESHQRGRQSTSWGLAPADSMCLLTRSQLTSIYVS